MSGKGSKRRPGKIPAGDWERIFKRVCPSGDKLCPCPDGDACHYEDVGTSKAMPKP
jgi:hypothetical protein